MIKLNPDKEQRDFIKKQLKLNEGYCPCQVPKSEDTKCPCKNFREEIMEGWCICELFQKIKDENK